MSGQDLMLELESRFATLDQALKHIGKRGRDYANAEMKYRVALAEKMLVERDKGTPVTILGDVCRGDREIARKKLERDIAESAYKAALEACNVYKLRIKVLEAQIEREYQG